MKTETKGPAHVDNLSSLKKLHEQGFRGIDASLAVSLFEYGLAWRELDNGETLFIYRHPTIEGRFDRCTIPSDVDVAKEWNWAKLEDVAECGGMSLEDWNKLSLPSKVVDLTSYYGEINVFGESYWEGFAIS